MFHMQFSRNRVTFNVLLSGTFTILVKIEQSGCCLIVKVVPLNARRKPYYIQIDSDSPSWTVPWIKSLFDRCCQRGCVGWRGFHHSCYWSLSSNEPRKVQSWRWQSHSHRRLLPFWVLAFSLPIVLWVSSTHHCASTVPYKKQAVIDQLGGD